MKFTRAALTGMLLWVLIFFEVSVLIFGFKLEQGTGIYYIIHYILLTVLILIASLVYFRKAKAGLGQGLLLGIFYIIVGVVLDSIITIPLFKKFDYSFLIQIELLVSYVITIIVCVIVGVLKK